VFLGQFEHQMDEKNRIAIPARFRDRFEAPALLTASPDGCIAVYTREGYESAYAEILALPTQASAGRTARRRFFGQTHEVKKDAQGRLVIPAALIAHAGLKKDVVAVGAGEWFEYWDKDAWAVQDAALAAEAG